MVLPEPLIHFGKDQLLHSGHVHLARLLVGALYIDGDNTIALRFQHAVVEKLLADECAPSNLGIGNTGCVTKKI